MSVLESDSVLIERMPVDEKCWSFAARVNLGDGKWLIVRFSHLVTQSQSFDTTKAWAQVWSSAELAPDRKATAGDRLFEKVLWGSTLPYPMEFQRELGVGFIPDEMVREILLDTLQMVSRIQVSKFYYYRESMDAFTEAYGERVAIVASALAAHHRDSRFRPKLDGRLLLQSPNPWHEGLQRHYEYMKGPGRPLCGRCRTLHYNYERCRRA